MKKITVFLVIAFTITCYSSVNAQVIYQENFQSGYVAGNLSGQQSWQQGFGGTPSPSATVTLDTGNYFIESASDSFSIKDAGNFDLTASDEITLTFDLYIESGGTNALFGIGDFNQASSSGGTPAVFGVQSGLWSVRGYGFGTTTLARDSGNAVISATQDNWYQVRSTWNLSGTGEGTLEIRNLTLGETSFTTLYFDAAQTDATADLGLGASGNPGVANWEGVFVRTTGSQVDNLNVVPEPSTMTLLLAAWMPFLLKRRQRVSKQ